MNPQATEALRIANERRATMRKIRTDIGATDFRTGCATVTAILDEPSEHEAAMPVGRLLLAIDRFGAQSLSAALRNAGILSADKRVRDLTARQRQALRLFLGHRSSAYRCRSKEAA